MCGEKYLFRVVLEGAQGSPPRVRGKVIRCEELARVVGITPACAGKSLFCFTAAVPIQDHPRIGGEKNKELEGVWLPMGSPPRGRGKVADTLCPMSLMEITPADAEENASQLNPRP